MSNSISAWLPSKFKLVRVEQLITAGTVATFLIKIPLPQWMINIADIFYTGKNIQKNLISYIFAPITF